MRAASFQPIPDRSMSYTRMESFARPISVSIAATCSATVASASYRGTGPVDSPPSGDAGMDVTITVPIVEDCRRFRGQAPHPLRSERTIVGELPERRGAVRRPRQRGAVDEKVRCVVEQLGSPIDVRTALRHTLGEGGRRQRAGVRSTCGFARREGAGNRAAVARSQAIPSGAAGAPARAGADRSRCPDGTNGVSMRPGKSSRRAGVEERSGRLRPARNPISRWCKHRRRHRRGRCAAAGRACHPARARHRDAWAQAAQDFERASRRQRVIILRAEAPAPMAKRSGRGA